MGIEARSAGDRAIGLGVVELAQEEKLLDRMIETGRALRDEDGADVSERFDFEHEGQKAVFNRVFSRRIASGRKPLELQLAEQAVQLSAHLPRPDFIVARKKKKGRASFFRIETRLFDYQGPYRKAASAD